MNEVWIVGFFLASIIEGGFKHYISAIIFGLLACVGVLATSGTVHEFIEVML